MRLEAQNILDIVPSDADEECLFTWNQCKRQSIDIYEKLFVNAGVAISEPANLEYAEWEDSYGSKYFGTREKGSKKRHGLIRIVSSLGNIIESTYYGDEKHGLSI